MKIYNVDEAFQILRDNKITTNKESLRRWLRKGVIKGVTPTSRKEGWTIKEKDLNAFIQQRLPDEMTDQIRAEMWMELARKNIFEGYVEIKKSLLHDCIQHRKYSTELEAKVWQRCIENSREYSKPRVSYLLEAFKFEGDRLLLDKNFDSLDEQIIFAIIDYVRKNAKK